MGDQDSLCPELEADAELSLCTWNVWSSKFERMARNVALLQCLSIHRPHVMVFQEVTPPFVRAVQACEWLKAEYWISATHHSQLGTLMVSRLKGESLKLITMPSRMGRRLLVLELPGGFRVATVHLESSASAHATRMEQLEFALGYLKQAPSSVLLGDFNFSDKVASEEPDWNGFQDVWRSVRPGEPGFTFDTVLNPMADDGRKSGYRARLDKVLVGGKAQGLTIQLLGTQPFRDEIFRSDHFGLLSRVRLSS